MEQKRVLALDSSGNLTYCEARPENRGKGKCPHIAHFPDYIQDAKEAIDAMNILGSPLKSNEGRTFEINKAKFNEAILKSHNVAGYKELKEAIEKHGVACIVQATGTGKSSQITAIIDDYQENTMYLSPNNYIIEGFKSHNKDNKISKDGKLWCETYQGLNVGAKNGFSKKAYKNVKQFKILVLDEIHRSGAEQWSKAIEEFIQHFNVEKIIGASATPVRSDGTDPSEQFCKGVKTSNITVEDAIANGILPMPHYYSIPRYENKYKNKAWYKKLSNLEQKYVDKFMNKKAKKYSELDNSNFTSFKNRMQDVYKNKKDGEPLKIVGFCKSIKMMKGEEGEYIKELVQNAFPDKHIIITAVDEKGVTSLYNSKDSSNDVKEVKEQEKQDYNNFMNETKYDCDIHVMLNVEVLTEGVHPSNVKTVILSGDTASDIRYSQQIGRCFSTLESDNKDITIFDIGGSEKKVNYNWKNIESNFKNQNNINDTVKYVYNNDEFYEDKEEEHAFITSMKQRGRYLAGEYNGKFMTYENIYREYFDVDEPKKHWEYKSRTNFYKDWIDHGTPFQTAIEMGLYSGKYYESYLE